MGTTPPTHACAVRFMNFGAEKRVRQIEIRVRSLVNGIMDTSNAAALGSPAHPNMQLWDMLYQKGLDNWTNEAADQELLKFRSTLTNGKTDLDILVPMCGKTKAMLSLAEEGHRIVGIEWSKVAVEQFFEENNLEYTTQLCSIGGTDIPKYKAKEKAVTIYCGDFFAFKQHRLDPFDCVFDHGSLGSFDVQVEPRTTYAEIINSFTKTGGRILLSIFDYEQAERPTMPFAVTEAEVGVLYEKCFKLQLLQEFDSKKMTDVFKSSEHTFLSASCLLSLSRFAWKILLLVKHSSVD